MKKSRQKCSNCHKPGHNRMSCLVKNPDPPQPEPEPEPKKEIGNPEPPPIMEMQLFDLLEEYKSLNSRLDIVKNRIKEIL